MTRGAGNSSAKDYPAWVCMPCGRRYGRRPVGICTIHLGECGVCGDRTEVTEPRDFGHLLDGWQCHTKSPSSTEPNK